jgi:hypothetical protein
MMAKKDKDKLYYEVTKEKSFGVFQMLLIGGSSGSVLSFLIVSLVCAYEGVGMDTLVLVFLLTSFLGFLFGAVITWVFMRYSEKFIPLSFLIESPSAKTLEKPAAQVSVAPEESPVVETEEAKGKSVDFVFPELSPDKQ